MNVGNDGDESEKLLKLLKNGMVTQCKTAVLPNAVVFVDDFVAATEHSFRIKLQFCQMRRDIFVFFHDVYCPPLW